MPWKLWNTRLTETMAVINKMNPTKGKAVQDYINSLTVPNRKLLSEAMAQGGYAANPQGKAMEKDERASRRALLLVLTTQANTGVPANDLERGKAAYRDNPGAQGKTLLAAALSDLDANIIQMQNGRVAVRADDAATWTDWDGTRQSPLLAGCAIGQRGTNGPGTLGCFVRYRNEIYILSNMHVLKKQSVTDTAILHPPHLLGGTYYDEIATYADGEPTLDAALARVKPGVKCENRTPEGTVIRGFNSSPNPHDPVFKRGVATRERQGEILGPNPKPIRRTNLVPKKVVVMTDQILVQQADSDTSRYFFQVEGDSGSTVIDEDGKVVALMHGRHPGDVAVGQATTIGAIINRWPGMEILGPGVHVAT
jgi:hypothetical protein